MTAATFANTRRPIYFDYGDDIEAEIDRLSAAIADVPPLADAYNPRWLAIQLLEGDLSLSDKVGRQPGNERVFEMLEASKSRLRPLYGDDIDVAVADRRYMFVHQLVGDAVVQPQARHASLSDRIDRYVTHPWLGLPIFLALMWVVFKVTADVSAPYLGWIDGLIAGPVTSWAVGLLHLSGLGDTWIESLVVDGIIAGVGGVLVFVPVMLSLYMVLAILEDSGYMARAAIVMDRFMGKIGLHGKSFLPMVVGFGCSVPAIYATRTMDSQRDRVLTGLLVPFMSCSARLPVYVLFAAIFFPAYAGIVIFCMYLLGIIVAIFVGLMLNHTLFKTAEASPLMMELPPYRLPTPRNVWRQMWFRTSSFIRNAWTIILVVSVALWFLLAIPAVGTGGSFADVEVEESVFGTISETIAPIFAPLGFESWQASGSLITGLVAKEVVVATMAQIYSADLPEDEAAPPTTVFDDLAMIVTSFMEATVDTIKSIPLVFGIDLFEAGETEEPTALMGAVHVDFQASSGGHGALAGLAFMVFVLLYTPCMVALAAERHELGANWMWVSVFGQLTIAWLAALFVFQVGKLLLG